MCVIYKIYLKKSFIFHYCAKPRLLKIHRLSFALCDVIKGKNKHNKTQHYAPCHNLVHLLIIASQTFIQYQLTIFQIVKVSAMSETFRYWFEKKGCEEGMWSFC